jgi:glycerol-1-phosphate dehydrogenase [NAD(P)+]
VVRDVYNLFGRPIACECGRTHRLSPETIVYADDAVDRLPELCAACCAGRNVAVVMDIRTREAAGRTAASRLSAGGWTVAEAVVPDSADGESPVCDDRTKETLAAGIPDADVFLAVGSGVVNDLAKWISWDRRRPYVSFATAASMNGYTSANVAATVEGLKTLLSARPPAVVAADGKILRDAPYQLTVAGLGDALAKSVSSADWYLNHALFGDYFCRRCVDLIAEIEPLYMDHPGDIAARQPGAIRALFDALLLTGAAMTMAESSAPASGGEHMISHSLDMMAWRDSQKHDLHGRQVGVGTMLTSELYRRVLATESPKFSTEAGALPDMVFWGKLAPAMRKEFTAKVQKYRLAVEKLSQGSAWDNLRVSLSPMLRAPEKIASCLLAAGAATTAVDIECTRERLLDAFLHGREIRARFTILDLAFAVGVLPSAASDIVHQWG